MGNTAKDYMNNMGFLMKELHKEWERTGVVKASILISLDEADGIHQKILKRVAEQQNHLETAELTFKQSIQLSRENYILLRLVKKIQKEKERTNKKRLDMAFSVSLDKEELKLYKEVLQSEKE